MKNCTNLKPCPFCGKEPLATISEMRAGWLASIECLECGFGIQKLANLKEDAERAVSKQWNTRAERTCRNVGPEGKDIFTCSECRVTTLEFVGMPCEARRLIDVQIGYCPNCGAKVVK